MPTEAKEIPVENKTANQAPMIVCISLAVIMISLLLAASMRRLRTCNGHLKKTFILSDINSSTLDTESVNDSIDLNSSLKLKEMLAEGRHPIVWKGSSMNGASPNDLDEKSMEHPNGENGPVTPECVTLEKVLFQGKYSDVWKGRFREQNVAIKIFSVTAISSWRKERDMYNFLAGEHSNVLKLITWNDAETGQRNNDLLWLMMDFCENGSLRDYLKNRVSSKNWQVELLFLLNVD